MVATVIYVNVSISHQLMKEYLRPGE